MDASPTSHSPPLPFGLHRLTAAMNAIGTLWIVALMVLIVADVLGRNFFASPVPGVTETVALSIVGIVFLQLADTLRCGRFTRAEVLLATLVRTRPAWHAALSALWHALGGALLLVILWASWQPLVEAVQIREYVGAVGSFQAPVWPVRLITLIGLSVTALTYSLLMVADLQRLARAGRDTGA
jgi:TRAP-type mannitol/chloroaromatic compound transport system permease small subunit